MAAGKQFSVQMRGEDSIIEFQGGAQKVLRWDQFSQSENFAPGLISMTNMQLNPVLKEIEINEYIPKIGKPVGSYDDLITAGMAKKGDLFAWTLNCYVSKKK
jgi:hypothetical protein